MENEPTHNCTYHLPGYCEYGEAETTTQEAIQEVTDTSKTKTPAEYKPPASAEEERQRFGSFLNEFLEEDDDTSQQQTSKGGSTSATNATTPPATSSLNIADEINKALDARESRKTKDDELGKLRADVDALKPKPKKAWHPWTLFSGVL